MSNSSKIEIVKVETNDSNKTSPLAHIYEEECNKRVLIIVTGGTFIMAPTPNGLIVQPGYLRKRMEKDEDFHHPSLPSYAIYEWEKPLDSSCITHEHWIRLAKEIEENYSKYAGFIILHGTDTMAYTASALSFMLENLSKPVVLTGAQIPIGEVFNDAKNNLIASLCVAGQCELCEVCLMFNNKLFRGNRATKLDAWHQDAFDSPNFPTLGIFGIDLEMEERYFLNAPRKRFSISTKLFTNIIVIWIIPGFDGEMLIDLLNLEEEKAIIFGFYGVGHNKCCNKLYQILYNAQSINNTQLVLLSQCPKGFVEIANPNKIENEDKDKNKDKDTSSPTNENKENYFDKLNILNAADMTVEACVAKLSYLMGLGYRDGDLKRRFEANLRGELTPTDELSNSFFRPNKEKTTIC